MRAPLILLALLVLVTPAAADEIEYLVPDMEGRAFSVTEGPRPYQHRLSFSPAFGRFGSGDYYAFRLGYAPNPWLAYEANVGHNPARSVHALMNTLRAVVRYPLPGRIQPYASFGYGMALIFPGAIFKADPVTKNVLSAGAGLEIFLREDVALRGEYRGTRLTGGESADGSLDYAEFTFGLSFFRSLGDRVSGD